MEAYPLDAATATTAIYRESQKMTLREWLEAQRIHGGPHGLECVGVDRLQQLWDAAVVAERARYSKLDIYPPNSEGKTQCIVRWMAETPHGWIGSWDRKSLENVRAEAIDKEEK